MSRTRTAVLISGRGSNMTVLVEAAKAADYPAEIALVLSNRPEAAGLAYAAGQRIPTLALDHRAYPDRGSFDAALDGALREAGIELVVLAGFMRILTPGFVARYKGRLLNIHPSLLPAFPGLHTHQRALDAGCQVAGATVHRVTAELDHGPILAQAVVPVLEGDTADSLAARVLTQEHRIYPQAIARLLAVKS